MRENRGFDFAAWAHVLWLHSQLRCATTLYLLNDNVIGPVSQAAFHTAIDRVPATPGDLVRMTEIYDRGWHIRGYFFVLGGHALRSELWSKFVQRIESLGDKDVVIDAYEVQLASEMAAAGLRTSLVSNTNFHSDPTIFHWRELLEDGFPFLKINTIPDEIPGVDKSGWRLVLRSRRFDLSIAHDVLAAITAS